MVRRIGTLAIAALSLPAVAADKPQEWRLAENRENGDWGRVLTFVDAGSIERLGDEVRFRIDMRIEHPPGRSDGLRLRMHVECDSKRVESSYAVLYSGDEPNSVGPPEAMHEARPGDGPLIASVCEGRWLSGKVEPIAYSREVFGAP